MIKPIRNEQDHAAAIDRMRELMMSGSGKEDLDEIDVLAAVIEKYERETFAIDAPSPTAAIKLRMEQLDLKARDLEPFIGSRARVSEVLSGKRKLTVDMMRALHSGLGIPYESLMTKEDPQCTDSFIVGQPVLTKLREIGIDVSTEHLSKFLQNAFGERKVAALPRKTRSQRASEKTDEHALLVWQGAVLTKAMKRPPSNTYSQKKIDKQFLISIAKLSVKPNGPVLAIERLSEYGIIVVVMPLLPGTFLDGAVMLLNRETPVIGLTLRYDRIDNFWFTLLHELSHLVRDYELLLSTDHVFFDDLELDSDDEREREADNLAKNCLIPSKFAKKIFRKKYASNEDMENVAAAAGVHTSIAAGRWQKENSNYKKFSRLIVRNTLRDMLAQYQGESSRI